MHRRDARRAQLARQAEIEFRRIDADEHVGRGPQEFAPHARPQPQQPRQIAQDLEQAHDGKRLGRLPGLAACREHLRSGDAEELRVRRQVPQCADQPRAERVARRLSRHQTHPQRHAAPRLLANDAARAEFDEIDEGPDLRLGLGRLLELFQGRART